MGKIRAHIGQLGRVVGQLEVTPLQRDARVTEELGRLICLRYRGLDAWSFHLSASRAGPSQLELEIRCPHQPVFEVEPLAPKLLQVGFKNSPHYSRFRHGTYCTVLRSRHFFRRFRLRMVKVSEPTPAPAPTYLGRLWFRLQAKKGGSRRLRTIFTLLNCS